MLLFRWLIPLLLFSLFFGTASGAGASDVLVIGDKRLRPVVELIGGIQEVLQKKVPVYTPSEVLSGNLAKIVDREETKTVIALGQESIDEALTLPTSITVLYALVILPPDIQRPNTFGMYMGTPIREYLKIVASFLPDLKKICVVGSPKVINVLDHSDEERLTLYLARNSFDFVNTIQGIDRADALLLLPDVTLLTRTALEESYLFSFRRKVPLLGISKKHVRQGALFALEFDPELVGRRLGHMAAASLQGEKIEGGQALPSKDFDLYINKETAAKMGISIPPEMLALAKNVYP